MPCARDWLQGGFPPGRPKESLLPPRGEANAVSFGGCGFPPGRPKESLLPPRGEANGVSFGGRHLVDLRAGLAHDFRPAILFRTEESAEFGRRGTHDLDACSRH